MAQTSKIYAAAASHTLKFAHGAQKKKLSRHCQLQKKIPWCSRRTKTFSPVALTTSLPITNPLGGGLGGDPLLGVNFGVQTKTFGTSHRKSRKTPQRGTRSAQPPPTHPPPRVTELKNRSPVAKRLVPRGISIQKWLQLMGKEISITIKTSKCLKIVHTALSWMCGHRICQSNFEYNHQFLTRIHQRGSHQVRILAQISQKS